MPYAWALQVVGTHDADGVGVIYSSHATGPTLPTDNGASLRCIGHSITTASALNLSRSFDPDAGILDLAEVSIVLASRRIEGITDTGDPGRVFGRRSIDGMPWVAELIDPIDRDTAQPVFLITNVGQSIASGDVLHIGGEAFRVDSVSVEAEGLEITVDERSVLGTDPLPVRIRADVGALPLVTPYPLNLRGRKALLWRAPVALDGTIGTWIVRYRGDLSAEPEVQAVRVTVRLTSLLARLNLPLAKVTTEAFFHPTVHTFANGVGEYVLVYAYARRWDIFEAYATTDVVVSDDFVIVNDGDRYGNVDGADRHAEVFDLTNYPYGHPHAGRLVWHIGQTVSVNWITPDGYTGTDQLDLADALPANRTVVGDDARALMISEFYTLILPIRLVDTSGGAVTATLQDLINAFNDPAQTGINTPDTLYNASFPDQSTWFRMYWNDGRWEFNCKFDLNRGINALIADHPQEANRIVAHDGGKIYDGFWIDVGGTLTRADWPDISSFAPEDGILVSWQVMNEPCGVLDPAVWPWGAPDEVADVRAAALGQVQVRDAFGRVRPRVVRLDHDGQTESLPAAPFAQRWYQEGETYITLDRAIGAPTVVEVRRGEEDTVIARFIATAETETAAGVWRVTVDTDTDREFRLPTLWETDEPGEQRLRFSPAIVARNKPLAEVVLRLLTSGGGGSGGLLSEYDSEPFGGRLRDGTGSLSNAYSGIDLDSSTILGLSALGGSTINVTGRGGDSIRSLIDGHLRAADRFLDLVTVDDPADPFKGCMLALRRLGQPSLVEIRATLDESDIGAGAITEAAGPIRNHIVVTSDYPDGSDEPLVTLEMTADTSVDAHQEIETLSIELRGVVYGTPAAMAEALYPQLTRRLRDGGFPRARYVVEAATRAVRALTIGDAIQATHGRWPLPTGELGVDNGVFRVTKVDIVDDRAASTVEMDYYTDTGTGYAPAAAVVDYVDATTLKVAANFFAAVRDPMTSATVTDLEYLVSATYGEGLGDGMTLELYPVGDPDNRTTLTVASYDIAARTVTFTGAHGIADPGAEVDADDYIAVIEARNYAAAANGHLLYFYHGRNLLI